ncbi:MAG: glycosyltransferase family 8 protein [Clostridia bacterium]|nr:glycosyltransferase family 8 protein [Clostridia bacterium]
MNIVATLNANYIKPLCVMLRSLLDTHPEHPIAVYIIHTELKEDDFSFVRDKLGDSHLSLHSVRVAADFLADWPVTFHFSKEMYYRIFAAKLLPPDVSRALYLDPDMVILSSLDELYHMDMGNAYFAAARSINHVSEALFKKRLHMGKDTHYFNSGVLLMNLDLLRREQNEQDVYSFIDQHLNKLVLPDQGILNALYADRTIFLDSIRYNFDVRYYPALHALSFGKVSIEMISESTCIVHYCGKHKPWHEDYRGECGVFYTMTYKKVFPTE